MLFARSLRPLANTCTHLSTRAAFTTTHPKVFSTMSQADAKPDIPNTPPAKWPSPEDWPASKVRQTFIDYFKESPGFEHTFWPSSGVIPFDDDTLLFANAVGAVTQASQLTLTGYEPVQAPLPGHCRPQHRPFQADPRGQLAKVHSRRRQAQW